MVSAVFAALPHDLGYFSYAPIPCRISTFAAFHKPLIAKVSEVVFPLYKAGSALFFTGYGVKEIVWDHRQSVIEHVHTNDINHKVLPTLGYPIVHGAFLVTTGLCEAMEALHAFALLNLGSKLLTIAAAGHLTFLFANVLALEENVNLYQQAVALGSGATEKECQQAEAIKKSAVLGIISNLGYVASAAIALLGISAAMALLLACFGSCWGGLKIIYDFGLSQGERL